MQLTLGYEGDFGHQLSHFQQRLYVARSLVPSGYEPYFQERARFWSAHTSTAIEGNPLADEQAMLVLVGGEAANASEQEKINLDEAYELIEVYAKDTGIKIDEGIIRGLNSMVLRGLPGRGAQARGRYRMTASAIVDANNRSRIRYLPPRPEDVAALMAAFVSDVQRWIKDDPGPIAAAYAHFGLISIHPFEDGNGRTARLLADLILSLTNSSADGMISVSQVIRGRLEGYYEALRLAQGEIFAENVDVTPFVSFHMGALCRAAEELENKVVSFNRHRDDMIRAAHGLLNDRQVTAVMFMIDIGALSSSTHARLTRVSQSTAQADLAGLAEKEFAVRTGTGKGTRYTLAATFEALRAGDAVRGGDVGEQAVATSDEVGAKLER